MRLALKSVTRQTDPEAGVEIEINVYLLLGSKSW